MWSFPGNIRASHVQYESYWCHSSLDITESAFQIFSDEVFGTDTIELQQSPFFVRSSLMTTEHRMFSFWVFKQPTHANLQCCDCEKSHLMHLKSKQCGLESASISINTNMVAYSKILDPRTVPVFHKSWLYWKKNTLEQIWLVSLQMKQYTLAQGAFNMFSFLI